MTPVHNDDGDVQSIYFFSKEVTTLYTIPVVVEPEPEPEPVEGDAGVVPVEIAETDSSDKTRFAHKITACG